MLSIEGRKSRKSGEEGEEMLPLQNKHPTFRSCPHSAVMKMRGRSTSPRNASSSLDCSALLVARDKKSSLKRGVKRGEKMRKGKLSLMISLSLRNSTFGLAPASQDPVEIRTRTPDPCYSPFCQINDRRGNLEKDK
jgi:hypothetical protein